MCTYGQGTLINPGSSLKLKFYLKLHPVGVSELNISNRPEPRVSLCQNYFAPKAEPGGLGGETLTSMTVFGCVVSLK